MTKGVSKFYVAGVQFHELRSISDKIEVGSICQLIVEPTNKYDPNAVRIEFNNVMLGYVPKKFSAMIAGFLTITELTCVVTAIDMSKKPWEQLSVEITEEEEDES